MVDETLAPDVDDGNVQGFQEAAECFAGYAVRFEGAVVVGLGVKAGVGSEKYCGTFFF